MLICTWFVWSKIRTTAKVYISGKTTLEINGKKVSMARNWRCSWFWQHVDHLKHASVIPSVRKMNRITFDDEFEHLRMQSWSTILTKRERTMVYHKWTQKHSNNLRGEFVSCKGNVQGFWNHKKDYLLTSSTWTSHSSIGVCVMEKKTSRDIWGGTLTGSSNATSQFGKSCPHPFFNKRKVW